MKYMSRLFLSTYRFLKRLRDKLFSLLVSGAFARFGRKTVLVQPIRLDGEERIAIGDRVYVGANCWLQTLPDGDNTSVAVSVGEGSSFAGACVISAARSVTLEDHVLLARNVYISDHAHKYSDTDIPIKDQGLDKIEPVLIKRGAWLGQNVVVCPGVTIGVGAVIGANSVVTQNIPDYCVAAGAPARVLKNIAPRPTKQGAV